MFPGDVDAAGPGTTPGEALLGGTTGPEESGLVLEADKPGICDF